MAEFIISNIAYCKIMLHALKYPHKAVNGVLLARKQANTFYIADAIPLFHITLELAPMLEIALAQIDNLSQNCRPQLTLAGYYQANEKLADCQPDSIATKIAEKIQSNFSDGLLCMVDNNAIGLDCDTDIRKHALKIYQFNDSKWKHMDAHRFSLEDEERCLASVSLCIQSKLYRSLVDFDNHLDQPNLDYFNKSLQAKINEALDL